MHVFQRCIALLGSFPFSFFLVGILSQVRRLPFQADGLSGSGVVNIARKCKGEETDLWVWSLACSGCVYQPVKVSIRQLPKAHTSINEGEFTSL